MFCSPIHLLNDMAIWYNPFFFNMLTESYWNYTNGNIDTYDCGITSAPCESNLTRGLVFSEPSFVYWFDLFVVFIGLTVVSLIGVIGNVINIIIISTSSIANDSTNNLYLWLSVSDLVAALNCGALVVVCYMCYIDDSIALSVFNMTFPYLFGNINKISLLSLDLVTVISIQRAVAIVFPFKISTIFTNRNTNIIIAVLICLGIIANLPLYAGQHPRFIFHPYFDKVVSVGYSYTIDYNLTMNYLTLSFYTRSVIDLVIIFFAVSLTIYKLHQQGKSRLTLKATPQSQTSTAVESSEGSKSQGATKSARENKVIKMSIFVCIISFICYCFNIVVSAILQIYANNLYQSPVPWATNNGGLLLNAVSTSFNFFLYLIMSTQYRENFAILFRLQKK